MTLDEAIKHAREVAEDNIQKSRQMTRDPFCVVNLDKIEACNKCAKEHEQLVDWLEELKKHRENNKKILEYIHSGNRGNCDYFIVDQIEELLEGGNNG